MPRLSRWMRHAGLLLGCLPSLAYAQTFTWNNAGGGSFQTASNWSPGGGPPGAAATANFNLNAPYTVTSASSITNAGLTQSNGQVDFSIGSGNTYTVTGTNTFQIGTVAGQSASFRVTSGTLQLNSSQSALGLAGYGALTVASGATANLSTNSYYDVGISGTGQLLVSGTVNWGSTNPASPGSWVGFNASGDGLVVVNPGGLLNGGANTFFGYRGYGELRVYSNSTANFASGLTFGHQSGSISYLSFDGIGPLNTTGTLNTNGVTLGRAGSVTVVPDLKGTWNNNGDMNLAALSGSIANVDLSMTVNQSGGSIYVGGTSSGDGGVASLLINDPNARVSITGAGNGLVVRTGGTLNLSAGVLNTSGFTRAGGAVNFTGGTLQVNSGTFDYGGGNLSYQGNLVLNNSTAVHLNDLTLANNATLLTYFSNATVSNNLTVGDNCTVLISNLTNCYVNNNLWIVSASGTGSVTVDSSYLSALGNVFIGQGGGTSILNINSFATVDAGQVSLYPTGTLNLNGGTLRTPTIRANGGQFNFNAGQLEFLSDWNANYSQISTILGPSASLGFGKTIQENGTTILGAPLNLTGGTFRTGAIANTNFLNLGTGLFEVTASNLTIGSAGLGPVLTVGNGLAVRVTNASNSLNIASDGLLYLNGGSASGTTINNTGEVNLASPVATLGLAGQALNNAGRIVGTGRVNANLSNNANGRIIVDAGQRLVFNGATNNNNNNGTMELSGGTLEFTNTLNNNAGGFISGRGVLRGSSANTSGTGLNNQGVVAFSGGVSDIYGKVSNTATGQIITAGAGVLTFHDDVVHNGAEIRTGAGSRTVFLGSASGAGPYTGTGTVEYQGDLRPGNSPANVLYSGNVVIGASATTHFEIGGLLAGSEYDRLTISGTINLDGLLDINLINAYTPVAGQQFTLIDNLGSSPIQGMFIGVSEGSQFMSGGQLWNASYSGGDGNNFVLTAVPEPGAWALILVGIGLAGGYWWKRHGNELPCRWR